MVYFIDLVFLFDEIFGRFGDLVASDFKGRSFAMADFADFLLFANEIILTY